jgi:predicted transcriptional regulator
LTAVLPPLGDLELAVLEDVWKAGAADAKSAHTRVGVSRDISLNTVQSTLERLHRKGLLRREKVSHAYQYEACIGRPELVGRLIESTVGRVSGMQTDVLMSAFVDLASRAGDDGLRQLEELVAARRAELEADRE